MVAAGAAGLESEMIVDLEQNPDSIPRASCTMPTLITHGQMYSMKRKRALLAEEHLGVQGHVLRRDYIHNRLTVNPYSMEPTIHVD
eukprot:444926-Alexandrium_andersonii.AAC.1